MLEGQYFVRWQWFQPTIRGGSILNDWLMERTIFLEETATLVSSRVGLVKFFFLMVSDGQLQL